MTVNCTGALRMRTGAQDKADIRDAEIVDPVMVLKFATVEQQPGKKALVLAAINVKGSRGGSLKLRQT
jgi:hypothetical protein